jgi:hypothetical protein
MERRMQLVLVGFDFSSAAFSAVPAEGDLRPDDDQGDPATAVIVSCSPSMITP